MNGIATAVTPEGWINLGEYNGAVKLNISSTWQNNFSLITIDEDDAGLYKLVFFWHNDLSGGTQPPASIENTLTTACAPQSLPYTENFESYGTGVTATLSSYWRKGTNNTTAYPYPYATTPVNGERSLYMYAYQPSSATGLLLLCRPADI